MKLILVEGIPGSGKSATARLISIQSERNGFRTRLFHESAFPHPVFLEQHMDNAEAWDTLRTATASTHQSW